MERNTVPLLSRLHIILGRPAIMLVREPMLLAMTLYMSVRPILHWHRLR